MTATETIRYLQNGGFFGARVIDGDETVFLQSGKRKHVYIDVYVGDKKKSSLRTTDFCEHFAHDTFRRVQPTEVRA